MSKRLKMRGLVIGDEAKVATCRCRRVGCAFAHNWLGVGAESAAVETAKQHAERSGHRVRVEYTRSVEYDTVASDSDHRLAPYTMRAAAQ